MREAELQVENARLRLENARPRRVADAAKRWLALWKNEGADGHEEDMTNEPDWPEVEVELVGAIDALDDLVDGHRWDSVK